MGTDHEKSILITVLNEIQQLRAEVRDLAAKDERKFEDVTGRVARLETEGVPATAMNQIKRLEDVFKGHIDSESDWQLRVDDRLIDMDRKQDAFQNQFIDSLRDMNVLTRDLGNTKADIVRSGKQGALAVGAVSSVVVNVIVGIVQALGGRF
jgi:hypothetical protein